MCILGGTSYQLGEKAAPVVPTQSRSAVHRRVPKQTSAWQDVSKYSQGKSYQEMLYGIHSLCWPQLYPRGGFESTLPVGKEWFCFCQCTKHMKVPGCWEGNV